MDGGGAFALLLIFIISSVIVATWLCGGSGQRAWKVKVLGGYCLLAAAPWLFVPLLDRFGKALSKVIGYGLLLSVLMILLAGFILPYVARSLASRKKASAD